MAGDEQPVPIDFCTLGMFIIDDIYPPPTASDQTPQKDIIGGAGTFSAIGARLFSPPSTSESVAWIVDCGSDFPSALLDTIASWSTSALIRPREGLTTRGWNGYSGNQHRSFKYLTEKKRLTAEDLTPPFLAAKSFHLICSPLRCIDQVTSVLSQRSSLLGTEHPRPIFIWEPVPDLCTAGELSNTVEALKYVDIISPNHEELASLFSFTPESDVISRSTVESHAQRLLAHGIGPTNQGSIVVRVGAEGCYISSSHPRAISTWLPAYHQDSRKVLDPTGGGNGFLGGLGVGLVRNDGDVVEAARWGSVAASFCIEQTGMPVLNVVGRDGKDEKWNGVGVLERLDEYKGRVVKSS